MTKSGEVRQRLKAGPHLPTTRTIPAQYDVIRGDRTNGETRAAGLARLPGDDGRRGVAGGGGGATNSPVRLGDQTACPDRRLRRPLAQRLPAPACPVRAAALVTRPGFPATPPDAGARHALTGTGAGIPRGSTDSGTASTTGSRAASRPTASMTPSIANSSVVSPRDQETSTWM
jgi:hypothetical protein